MDEVSIQLSVVSYGGSPPSMPLAVRVGSGPVVIGREEGCDLCLDDPERLVSRRHALVEGGRGRCPSIENLSICNVMMVGGRELLPGDRCDLGAEDQVLIGRYVLALECRKEEHTGDVFGIGDQRADTGDGGAAEVAVDGLDVFAIAASARSHEAVEALPEDFYRAFGDDGALLAALPEIRGEPIPEPEAAIAAGRQLLGGRELDPLSLFGGGDEGAAALLPGALDHALEVDSPFVPPLAVRTAEMVAGCAERGADSVVDGAGVSVAQAPPAVPTASSAEDVRAVVPSTQGVPNLHAALARGLGVAESALPGMDEAFVERLGAVLAALAQGTVQLVQARSATKHEMRADVTIIVPDGNNPLKFAPDGKAAVLQLLAHRAPGFMPPLPAIRDAFDDLAAHQAGLMAGARAAVYDALGHFRPEELQSRLGAQRVPALFGGAMRKARLWELYEQKYQRIAGEAREDFELSFQRAFGVAYEKEIGKLAAGAVT